MVGTPLDVFVVVVVEFVKRLFTSCLARRPGPFVTSNGFTSNPCLVGRPFGKDANDRFALTLRFAIIPNFSYRRVCVCEFCVYVRFWGLVTSESAETQRSKNRDY